jgi:hypothetical protein
MGPGVTVRVTEAPAAREPVVVGETTYGLGLVLERVRSHASAEFPMFVSLRVWAAAVVPQFVGPNVRLCVLTLRPPFSPMPMMLNGAGNGAHRTVVGSGSTTMTAFAGPTDVGLNVASAVSVRLLETVWPEDGFTLNSLLDEGPSLRSTFAASDPVLTR